MAYSILTPYFLFYLGSFKNEQASHFKRAVYGRLEKAALSLPADYRLNKCEIYTTSLSSNNEDVYSGKSSQYSINWCDGDDYVEIVDGTLGSLVGRYYYTIYYLYALFRRVSDKDQYLLLNIFYVFFSKRHI